MSTINGENAKQIRKPFEVYCNFSTAEENNTLSYTLTASSSVSVKDSNLSTMLGDPSVSMRILADLSADGFPMDGTAEFYQSLTGSQDNGKVGIRTTVNGTAQITVTGTQTINALTVAITDGTGYITAGGVQYEARRIVVIPVNAKTRTLTFTATDDTRLSIASIVAGISLQFTNDNLVSCTLALRSDLNIVDPTWEVSDIEIQAYYPDDISKAISNIGDDVPITYYAGYQGDYSPVRTFYLADKVENKDNIITLKGVDISHKLEKEISASVVNWSMSYAMQNVYSKLFSTINTALGGKFPIKKQSVPPRMGTSTVKQALVFREATAGEIVANIMNIAHGTFEGTDFYPVFVDAGIPVVRWSKPSPKWDIYEEDCGDVLIEYDRNINKLSSNDTSYWIANSVKIPTQATEIERLDVTAGKIYTVEFSGYVSAPTVTNADVISATASKITFKAKKTTKTVKKTVTENKKKVTKEVKENECVVKGKTITTSGVYKTLVPSTARAGISKTIYPSVLGRSYCKTTSTLMFPNWSKMFGKSNETGSFIFKGDPRMQPRDVFRFHRLNGSVENCTIESITLMHDGGGTQAELTYRKGII